MDKKYKFHIFQIKNFVSFFFFNHYFILLDTTIPLSNFLIPNPNDNYKLEGRKAIFNSDFKSETRSLIMKERIKNGIIEVFVLFFFYLFNYYL
jgi:hypothetical protein